MTPAAGYVGLSENGWPCYDDAHFRDHGVFVKYPWLPGQGWWWASQDVATIMGEYLAQFNDRVDGIAGRVLDDWTRALRPVRGKTSGYSNHGSLTAGDVNATEYPRGRRNMTKAQIDEVHDIIHEIEALVEFRPLLRWGGDYKSPSIVDQMHIEIHPQATRADIALAARKLRTITTQEVDMQFTDKVKLTKAAADAVGKKEGDEVTIGYLIQWSPLTRKTYNEVVALRASVDILAKAVQAVAAGSPAEVQQAFSTGIAALKTELSSLEITIGEKV